jgi:hypothetical protein
MLKTSHWTRFMRYVPLTPMGRIVMALDLELFMLCECEKYIKICFAFWGAFSSIVWLYIKMSIWQPCWWVQRFVFTTNNRFLFLMMASLFLIAARSAAAQKTRFLSRCSSVFKIFFAFASTMIWYLSKKCTFVRMRLELMFLSYHMAAQGSWKFSGRECFTVTYIINLVQSIHILCV